MAKNEEWQRYANGESGVLIVMTELTTWPAPAKLNLFLHITGRREDGYHALQTVFQLLDFGDRLGFEITDDGEITRVNDIDGVSADEDLVVRAARLLQSHTQCTHGARIKLDKRLPMGGGLGGGSSDAATTLVALNHLWQLQLAEQELLKLALKLGADVPVFVYGRSAWAEGIGERLEAIELGERHYLVITPSCHINTSEIFSLPELTRNCPPITIAGFLRGVGVNVFESVVARHYPPVLEALAWLSDYGKPRMTGTGASVFASFKDEAEAQQALAKVPGKWRAFVAKGVDVSPLVERLRSPASF